MYARMSTTNRAGLHPNLAHLGFFGDNATLTPAQAVQQALSTVDMNNINPKDRPGFDPNNQNWNTLLVSQSGHVDPAGYSPTCAGQAAPNVNLFQTAGGFALGTTSAGVGILGATGIVGAAAIPVAGAAIAAAAVVIQLIGTIFAHHAAAARQEQQLGCGAIAAWNNSISLIANAVQNGQMTAAAATGSMDDLYSHVSSYLAPCDSHSPWCSACCELLIGMHAAAIYLKSKYTALAAQQAAETQQAIAASTPANAPMPGIPTIPQSLTPPSTGLPAYNSAVTAPPIVASSIPAWMWLAAAIVAWKVL